MVRKAGIVVFFILLICGIYWYKNQTNSLTFIQACKDLNGKELTVAHLQTVSNQIYYSSNLNQTVGIEAVQQYHIEQYLSYLNKQKEKLPPSSHFVMIVDDMITLSEGDLDNTWRCNIKADNKRRIISTDSYYQPE